MKENERTLAIIKPDAFQRKLVGQVLSKIERKGFKIVALKMVHMTKKQAELFYQVHRNKPFYDSVTQFMSSSPCLLIVLEGYHIIDQYRDFIGNTDPAKANYGTIRREFGTSIERNVVHGSDSATTAQREIQFFFTQEEFIQ